MTDCTTCAGCGRVFEEHDQNDELGQLCRTCAGQGLLSADCPACGSTGEAATPLTFDGPAPFDEVR